VAPPTKPVSFSLPTSPELNVPAEVCLERRLSLLKIDLRPFDELGEVGEVGEVGSASRAWLVVVVVTGVGSRYKSSWSVDDVVTATTATGTATGTGVVACVDFRFSSLIARSSSAFFAFSASFSCFCASFSCFAAVFSSALRSFAARFSSSE
jgi:hypothetical protein